MPCVHCGSNEDLFEVKIVDLAGSLAEYATVDLCKECLHTCGYWCEDHGVATLYRDTSESEYFGLHEGMMQAVCLKCTAEIEKTTGFEYIQASIEVAREHLSPKAFGQLSVGLPDQLEKNDEDFFLITNLMIFSVISERTLLQVITDHMVGVNRAVRNN